MKSYLSCFFPVIFNWERKYYDNYNGAPKSFEKTTLHVQQPWNSDSLDTRYTRGHAHACTCPTHGFSSFSLASQEHSSFFILMSPTFSTLSRIFQFLPLYLCFLLLPPLFLFFLFRSFPSPSVL